MGKGEPPRRVAPLGRVALVRAKRGLPVPSGVEIRFKDLPSSEVVP
jgi:hypothetical protein